MGVDYPLNLLISDEFEKLVVSICNKILGIGTTGFAPGKDGGRDAKFQGVAQFFPSEASPWSGKFIIQAKHTSSPYASCSESDFSNIVKNEIPKIKKLKDNDELDYYLLFTNRRLTGQTDNNIITQIKKETGIKDTFIFANEKIQDFLSDYPELAKKHGLIQFLQPLDFYEEDICDVIKSFPDVNEISQALDKDKKWLYISKEEKNKLNNLSKEYFQNVLRKDVLHFEKIKTFLEDPANYELKEKYDCTIYDLRAKIETYRSHYQTFEEIFDVLFEYIFNRNKNIFTSKKRILIRVFLHYMYFICDIGRKENDEIA